MWHAIYAEREARRAVSWTIRATARHVPRHSSPARPAANRDRPCPDHRRERRPPIEDGTVVVSGGSDHGRRARPGGDRSRWKHDHRGPRAVGAPWVDRHARASDGCWEASTVDQLAYWRQLDALLLAGVTTGPISRTRFTNIQQLRQEIDAGRLDGPRIFMVAVDRRPNPVWPPISFANAADSQIPGFSISSPRRR